jgi:hypothetical protein
MPWVVGIDEAGYGPNLGPLVQAAVGLWLPPEDPAGWETLKPFVRRAHEKADGRLLVDDSKKVYARPNGLAELERTSLACCVVPCASVGSYFSLMSIHTPNPAADRVMAEKWFTPDSPMPIRASADSIQEGSWRFLDLLGHLRVSSWVYAPTLLGAGEFNELVDRSGTKAAAVASGLVRLLGLTWHVGRFGVLDYPDDPIIYICDKLGGRNFYAPMLQAAFPDGWVVALKEGADESRYRIDGLGRDVTVIFRPRADGDSVSVALASMVAKYLREVCILQFNAFWAKHVPGLKPTAGYPGDAKRFFAAIKPAMEKLGIPEDAVWRKK